MYLEAPVVDAAINTLVWWKVHSIQLIFTAFLSCLRDSWVAGMLLETQDVSILMEKRI
jgi:hypothetical protein